MISLHFLPEFIGELKDKLKRPLVVKYSDKADSPLQDLEQKLENSTGKGAKGTISLAQARDAVPGPNCMLKSLWG